MEEQDKAFFFFPLEKHEATTGLPYPNRLHLLKVSLLVRATLISPLESREASSRHAASPTFEIGKHVLLPPQQVLYEAEPIC